ncbi:MAG: helix-turn-helix transcriptional regulator [bacterium]|nr:helix-turn-helix transcriptional regulator [bacterium]
MARPVRPPATRIVNRLPALLAARGMTWGELRRRTLLPARMLSRLRAADANPRLRVAERVAAALDVRIEDVWRCRP